MDIYNTTPFSFATLPGRIGYPAHSLTFIVKCTLRMEHQDVAQLCEEQRYPNGDVSVDPDAEDEASLAYASDFAHFKPKADVLLVGNAYAHSSADSVRAAINVGNISKVLRVFGNRRAEASLVSGTKPSQAEPFKKMAMIYENAYGGAGFQQNPVGKGRDRKEFPNIEYPSQPIDHLEISWPPAGFGPVSSNWAPRTNHLGTYDEKYVETRWPWFPKDFDFGFYNVAPEDQQVEGYLRGDENIAIENLHPSQPFFKTTLPGIRPRLFLTKENEVDFDEVSLNLDTLWILPDEEQIVLIWRGVTPVDSEEFEEIQRTFLAAESISEPKSAAHYKSEFDRVLAEFEAEWDPEEPPEEPVTESDPAPKEKPVDPGAAILEKIMADHKAKCDAKGIDPDAEPVLSPEQEKERQRILEEIESKRQAAVELADTKLKRKDVEERLLEKQPLAGEDLSGLDLSGLNLSNMDLSDSNLSAANLSNCDARNAIFDRADLTAAVFEKSTLSGASFQSADLTLAQFDRADLSHADLSDAIVFEGRFYETVVNEMIAVAANFAKSTFVGIRFINTDLSESHFADSKWSKCKIAKSKIANSVLARSTFADCSFAEIECEGAAFNRTEMNGCRFESLEGENVVFEKSQLSNAVFRKCSLDKSDFSQSKIENSTFEECSLNEASMAEAEAQGINLNKAKMLEFRASGGNFVEGSFRQIEGFESIWDETKIDKADFSGSELEGADFSTASMKDSAFESANLKFANIAKSNCTNAQFLNANLFEAVLTKTDFSGADLRGANLYGAEVLQAKFDKARLDNANIKMTKLQNGVGLG